ncbi:MAG: HAD-IIB family hydrolase [Saccharospirillaceae bacterium]|nr:HAD-IIB family hydrolase [Saccharospirillaceae bacterium]MCD8531603.1 HAD-IIB family hydrolase [Saccharospirillaceae bacterium]
MNTAAHPNTTPPQHPLIVVTDLDGCLLDHHSYSAQAAEKALKTLKSLNIPCVFNSSKTYGEMLALREKLNNPDPFVCENGGAIFIPKSNGHGYNSEILHSSYLAILKVLHSLRQQGFQFRGFNDMTATEVAALTGLSVEDAHLAKQRSASEPLLWTGSDEQLTDFRRALAMHNLRLLSGGRFHHVMGPNDKAHGLEFCRHHYQTLWQQPVRVIALGDGENDRAMLSAADFAIVIPGIKSTLDLQHPQLRIASKAGPAGWNETLLSLLDDLFKEAHSG